MKPYIGLILLGCVCVAQCLSGRVRESEQVAQVAVPVVADAVENDGGKEKEPCAKPDPNKVVLMCRDADGEAKCSSFCAESNFRTGVCKTGVKKLSLEKACVCTNDDRIGLVAREFPIPPIFRVGNAEKDIYYNAGGCRDCACFAQCQRFEAEYFPYFLGGKCSQDECICTYPYWKEWYDQKPKPEVRLRRKPNLKRKKHSPRNVDFEVDDDLPKEEPLPKF